MTIQVVIQVIFAKNLARVVYNTTLSNSRQERNVNIIVCLGNEGLKTISATHLCDAYNTV